MTLPLPTNYVAHDARSSVAAVNGTNTEINALGVRMTAVEASSGGGGGGGGFSAPFIVVAASNSSASIRASANYVCGSGNDNQVQINQALTDAAALVVNKSDSPVGADQAGMVLLAGGNYRINAACTVPTGVIFSGVGPLTHIRTVSCNSAGAIMLRSVNDRLTRVTSMYLDGTGGGTCDAINYNQAGSDTSTGGYLISANDANHVIDHLWIRGFGNPRNGIVMTGGGDGRGTDISYIQQRDTGGIGINMDQHSDSRISHVHLANATNIGIRIGTGNMMMTNCKAFFNGTWGFRFESGRHTISNIQSQDDQNGIYFGATDMQASNVTVDSAGTNSIQIATSGTQLNGFTIINRNPGAAFATTQNGLVIGASLTDLGLYGRINPTAITNKVTGTPGARSHYAYTDGTTLFKTP